MRSCYICTCAHGVSKQEEHLAQSSILREKPWNKVVAVVVAVLVVEAVVVAVVVVVLVVAAAAAAA